MFTSQNPQLSLDWLSMRCQTDNDGNKSVKVSIKMMSDSPPWTDSRARGHWPLQRVSRKDGQPLRQQLFAWLWQCVSDPVPWRLARRTEPSRRKKPTTRSGRKAPSPRHGSPSTTSPWPPGIAHESLPFKRFNSLCTRFYSVSLYSPL